MSHAADLAEGFAAQAETWAARLGASAADAAAARAAARALVLETTEGHVCITLTELAELDELAARAQPTPAADPALPQGAQAWAGALLRSGTVGRGAEGAQPLVLDDEGRLYLRRHHALERRLARRLVQAASRPVALDEAQRAQLHTVLDELFPAPDPGGAGEPDRQRLAAELALRSRLAVISGGPGTGKTTTVVKLLAALLALQPDARIALAAPTGKAAARLSQTIRERAAHWPEALRARLPAQGSTVHRLLGAGPRGFAHGPGQLLPVDVLVVDEASMLDLALATQLVEAVPPDARLVLLGDKDQLAAVEAGAVFAELGTDPTVSAACCAELTRGYRFSAGSEVGQLAQALRAGDGAAAAAMARPPQDALALACAGYAPYLQAVARAPTDAAAAFEAFERFRVLCALREGPWGVQGLNAELDLALRQGLRQALGPRAGAAGFAPGSPWYAGRPVVILRNDALLQLHNGDVGLALPGEDGTLLVHVPQPGGGLRAVAPARLPAHETAWALTVHKAQGSEFDEVLLALPPHDSRVLTRELLYTAVTRARQRVQLCGAASVIAAAAARRTTRRSGLQARLAEQARGVT